MVEIILEVTPSSNYFKRVSKTIKRLMKSNDSLVYVTTNKPFNNIDSLLKKEKIKTKNIFFIDCITKKVAEIDEDNEPENCLFIEDPQQITELSISIDRATKLLQGKKVVIIDSLSALLIYNNEKTVGKFVNFIINRLRSKNISTVLIALNSDADKEIIKTIESFVDRVIKK